MPLVQSFEISIYSSYHCKYKLLRNCTVEIIFYRNHTIPSGPILAWACTMGTRQFLSTDRN